MVVEGHTRDHKDRGATFQTLFIYFLNSETVLLGHSGCPQTCGPPVSTSQVAEMIGATSHLTKSSSSCNTKAP